MVNGRGRRKFGVGTGLNPNRKRKKLTQKKRRKLFLTAGLGSKTGLGVQGRRKTFVKGLTPKRRRR